MNDNAKIPIWVLLPKRSTAAKLKINIAINKKINFLGNIRYADINKAGIHILNIRKLAIPVAFTGDPPQNIGIFLSGCAKPPSFIFNKTEINEGKEYKIPKITKIKNICL